ncbi:hypothetical protein SASPL_128985 [Salvia splendens]|uniref:BZIP domain-containing protein n=1 Tax=Salvia splendens TaxID=180675 RepID=A0A8X8ZMK4_SALSN|nr:hypothetical protein SASPL_128985 [Salvia splendens]
MDDGELDFPNDPMLSCLDITNAQSSCSFDIDEFLSRTQSCNDALGRTEAYTDGLGQTQACTHAHACNPSGPDQSHTHTCIHVHTQIMPSPSEGQDPSDDTAESVDKKSKKRSLGNREAVRKYREKKKARAASLEDEVIRLRALNQQLMKRLQEGGMRIEGEIGSFPYRKPNKSGDVYQNMVNPNSTGRSCIEWTMPWGLWGLTVFSVWEIKILIWRNSLIVDSAMLKLSLMPMLPPEVKEKVHVLQCLAEELVRRGQSQCRERALPLISILSFEISGQPHHHLPLIS